MAEETRLDAETVSALVRLAREALDYRDARDTGREHRGRPLHELLAAAVAAIVATRPEFWALVEAIAKGDIESLQELLS